MRVIFVTSKLNFIDAGGSVTDLDLKAENLKKFGHDISVITVYSHKNKINKELPYQVIEEQFKSFNQLPVQYWIYKLLKKYSAQADIFHIEGQYMYGAGLFKLLGGRVPVVSFFNREFISWPSEDGQREKQMNFLQQLKAKVRYSIEKYFGGFLANSIDFFIFTTPHIKEAYYGFGLSPKVPVTVMPDFIDEQRIMQAANITSEEIQKKRQVIKETTQIYCTGRMIPEKGFDLVLQAFSQLEDKSKFKLVIGGDGPEKDKLVKMAKDLNIEKYVEFPGWVDYQKMAEFLSNSDIFILPRWRFESSSVILIEAMVLALPSIVFSGGALEWLVDNPQLIFKAGDSTDLANKINQLANSNQLRVTLGNHCQQRIMRDFHHQKLASQLNDLMVKLSKK